MHSENVFLLICAFSCTDRSSPAEHQITGRLRSRGYLVLCRLQRTKYSQRHTNTRLIVLQCTRSTRSLTIEFPARTLLQIREESLPLNTYHTEFGPAQQRSAPCRQSKTAVAANRHRQRVSLRSSSSLSGFNADRFLFTTAKRKLAIFALV